MVLAAPGVAVGVLLLASEVALGALLLPSEVVVGALLSLVAPPALPALTANFPDCWRLPPRPTRANHSSRGYQQRNFPAQVPNPALPPSQPPPALARSAMTMWGKPSPYPTSHGQVGHGAPSRTGVRPAGTTPTCSLPPAASIPANGANAWPPARPPLPTGRSRPHRTSTRGRPSSCPRGLAALAGRTQQQQIRPG